MITVAACQEALKDKSNPKLFLELCQKFVDDMTVFMITSHNGTKHEYCTNNGKIVATAVEYTKNFYSHSAESYILIKTNYAEDERKSFYSLLEADSYIAKRLKSLGYVMSTDPPTERV